ncbi:amidohydrolase family protein [Halopseudomonas pelagia]|uniref:amidohydrolase family protein n=1 Tax=Halopseudomonas pelagia TaxID=553151 RepID=UPI0030D861B4|tara:strand:- start:52168 stop:52977 length:810 start_codon:yes stop_codon:yes gene_type:complete
MGQQFPGRFGFFAVLPIPLAEASCKEAIYALDQLGADGVVLLGSTRSVFLGDPSLDELMAELDSRGTTIFVHPNLHATSVTLGLDLPGFLVEFLCDTTRAAANLILSGTLERYPNVNWILSHSGGFLPYIAWRLTLADQLPEYAAKIPKGVMHYIRRFYYDTALSPSRYSQLALKALIEPEQILFGSDFPFAPALLTRAQCNTLEALEFWNTEQQYGIDRGHALQLFPQYRLESEQIASNPINNIGLNARFQSARTKAAARIGERLRNH